MTPRTGRKEFLAMLIHETRTPLIAVMGYLELLEETALTEEQRRHVAAVRRGAETLAVLSRDLLDYFRAEAPGFALVHAPFDPRLCLAESAEPFLLAAHRRGIVLRQEAGDAVPARVVGDAFRLRQILANLLSNAVKFTEEGEIVARLDAGPEERSLLFTVRDTGRGMAPETMRRLFEPFFQAPGEAERLGGTGLGLAIAWRLARGMGGALDVASGPGRGTLFRLTLPVAEPPGD